MVVSLLWDMRGSSIDKRTHKKVAREVFRLAMVRHRDNNLKKHFENRPETEPGGAYGYTKRSERYNAWKIKKMGHATPNVLSGRTRRLTRLNARITATSTKGAKMRSSTHFPRNEDRRAEIEAISVGEQRRLARLAELDYARLAKLPQFQRKQRKRRTR